MIWHTIINVFWALVRNAFQKGHQCISLEQDLQWGWEWQCSCGKGESLNATEVKAIESYRHHIKGAVRDTRRFEESVSIEGLVKK